MLKVKKVLETAGAGVRQSPLFLVRQGYHCFRPCLSAGQAFSFRHVNRARDAGSAESLGDGWVRSDEVNGLGASGVGHLTRGERSGKEAIRSVCAHGRSCRRWGIR